MLQLITLKWDAPETPTLDLIRKILGLSLIAIDSDYGIKEKDTQQGLFTIIGDDKILKNYKDTKTCCTIVQ